MAGLFVICAMEGVRCKVQGVRRKDSDIRPRPLRYPLSSLVPRSYLSDRLLLSDRSQVTPLCSAGVWKLKLTIKLILGVTLKRGGGRNVDSSNLASSRV